MPRRTLLQCTEMPNRQSTRACFRCLRGVGAPEGSRSACAGEERRSRIVVELVAVILRARIVRLHRAQQQPSSAEAVLRSENGGMPTDRQRRATVVRRHADTCLLRAVGVGVLRPAPQHRTAQHSTTHAA